MCVCNYTSIWFFISNNHQNQIFSLTLKNNNCFYKFTNEICKNNCCLYYNTIQHDTFCKIFMFFLYTKDTCSVVFSPSIKENDQIYQALHLVVKGLLHYIFSFSQSYHLLLKTAFLFFFVTMDHTGKDF